MPFNAQEAHDLLRRYYRADDRAAEEALDRLCRCLRPMIVAFFHRRLCRLTDIEDLTNVAARSVAHAIQESKQSGERVEHLVGFTCGVSRNVLIDQHRKLNPSFRSLKTRVLYLLEGRDKRQRFARWTIAAPPADLGGLKEWKGRAFTATPRYWSLLKGVSPLHEYTHADPNPRETMERLFQWLGTPLEVEELIAHLADLYRVHGALEIPFSQLPGEGDGQEEQITSAFEPDPSVKVIDDNFMDYVGGQLWPEILSLPLLQRVALLLSIEPDELDRLGWIFGQVAAALPISEEQLFPLWNRMPLSDQSILEAITGSLNIETAAENRPTTTQQIINLRMSARKRLRNRMKGKIEGW